MRKKILGLFTVLALAVGCNSTGQQTNQGSLPPGGPGNIVRYGQNAPANPTAQTAKPLFNGTSDLVQKAINATDSTSTTCTFASAPTVGNFMLFIVGIYNPSNTTTAPNGVSTVDDASGSQMRIYDRFVQSGDGKTYTFTASATSHLTVSCEEWAGVNSTTPIDQETTANFSNKTSVTTASLTPAASGELPVVAWSESQSSSFSGLSSGYTSDQTETSAAEYADIAHGAVAGTSAVSASLTFGAASYGGDTIILLNPAPTGTPTPQPTGTPFWVAGSSTIGTWVNGQGNQCGSATQVGGSTGTNFTFDMSQAWDNNGTASPPPKATGDCGRQQVNPETGGNSGSYLVDGTTYLWEFTYKDNGTNGMFDCGQNSGTCGSSSSGCPGGSGCPGDARSLIWQIHPNVCSCTPVTTLNFINGTNQVSSPQKWGFFDGGTTGAQTLEYTRAYTEGETVVFAIKVKQSNPQGTANGAVTLWVNNVQVYNKSGVVTSTGATDSSPTTQWWNFGPYKWIWENSPNDSFLSEIQMEIDGMNASSF